MNLELALSATALKKRATVGLIFCGAGVVLPIGLLFGVEPMVEHGRTLTHQEVALGASCSVVALIFQSAAMIAGLASRCTILGKVVVALSGVLLLVSTLAFAFALTTILDDAFGWAEASFLPIALGTLAAISLLLVGPFRALRPH